VYMVFVKEMTWVDIAGVLDCERTTVKRHYTNIMKYLQAKASSRPSGVLTKQ
jgi:FixJ family two-component response regulator